MIPVGFSTGLGGGQLTLPQVAAWAEEHGLDTLEINCGPTFGSHSHLDVQQVLRDGPGPTHELMAKHKLEISSLAPMLNLLVPDDSLRQEYIDYFRSAIDACAVLDVPVIVTYGGSAYGMYFFGRPGTHRSDTYKLEENLELFRDIFEPLCAHAEQKGVRIAMETAPRGGGHGNVAHSPYLWERVFDLVPNPALGLSFDPSHLIWIMSDPAQDVIREWGKRIYHVDGKDCAILTDVLRKQGILSNAWWRYRIPGRGELDWNAIFVALNEIGYKGTIDVENEDDGAPGLEGVAQAVDYLKARQQAG